MALPASGVISLGLVRPELNRISGPQTLAETFTRTLTGKSTGAVKMSDLYSKSLLVTRGLVSNVDTKSPACLPTTTSIKDSVANITYGLSKAVSYTAQGAIPFDGATTLSTTGNPAPTNNFTIESWCYPTATHEIDPEAQEGGLTYGTSGQRWITSPSHQGDVNGGCGISVGTNGISVYEHGSGYMPSLLTYQAAITGMTHLMVVYTNKQPSLYVNGVLVRTGLVSVRQNVYASVYGIGYGSYGYFAGSIGCLRVFSVSLTGTEVLQNYNAYKAYYQ
jgi:hypothetical protein